MTASTIKRSKLYERVWAEPVIRVAAELGTTNFMLAELCRRYAIPTPSSGYWMKLQFGKRVEKPDLPEGDDVEIDLTKLARAGYRPSKLVTRAERRAGPPPVEVTEPHPRVAKTIDRLKAGKGEGARSSAGKGCFSVTVSETLIDRVQLLLSTLVKEIEDRGGQIVHGEKGLEAKIDGHQLSFVVKEKFDRVPHRITELDRAALARHEAKIAADTRPWASLTWNAPKIPQHDYLPTGKLTLQLEDKVSYRGVRKTFSDRVSLRVEMMACDVVDAMQGYAKAEDEWLEERERRRLEYEEQARLEAIARKRQALEGRRVEFLERQLARLSKIEQVQRLQQRLASAPQEGDVERFGVWMADYLGRLEHQLSPEVLAAKLATTNLMSDDAEINDWIDVETGRYGSTRFGAGR